MGERDAYALMYLQIVFIRYFAARLPLIFLNIETSTCQWQV